MSKELEIFPRTRQAIEASTFPLSMALKNHYFKDDPVRFSRTATDRARNRFCVEEPELSMEGGVIDALIGGLTDNLETLRTKSEELDSLADKLRWSERLSVSAIPQLVRRRVAEAMEARRGADQDPRARGTVQA